MGLFQDQDSPNGIVAPAVENYIHDWRARQHYEVVRREPT